MATVEIERVSPEEVGTLPRAKVSSTQQRSAETLAFKAKAERRPSVMERLEQRSFAFKVGQTYLHDEHGEGEVVSNDDAGVTVRFEAAGATHTYDLASLRKLKPVLQDAHTYTAASLFDLLDTDGSGTIDKSEFVHMHEMTLKGERAAADEIAASKQETARASEQNAMLSKGLVAALVLIVVLLGSNSGLMALVTAAYKDTYVDSDSRSGTILIDGASNPIATAEATESVPLYAAPFMEFVQLSLVRRLTISYGVDGATKETAVVSSVRQTGPSSATFDLGCARSVVISSGTAALVDGEAGTHEPLCAANVSCAAFTVRQEDAAALLARADAALAEAGVLRRRLDGDGDEEACAVGPVDTPLSLTDTSAFPHEWIVTDPPIWSPAYSWEGVCVGAVTISHSSSRHVLKNPGDVMTFKLTTESGATWEVTFNNHNDWAQNNGFPDQNCGKVGGAFSGPCVHNHTLPTPLLSPTVTVDGSSTRSGRRQHIDLHEFTLHEFAGGCSGGDSPESPPSAPPTTPPASPPPSAPPPTPPASPPPSAPPPTPPASPPPSAPPTTPPASPPPPWVQDAFSGGEDVVLADGTAWNVDSGSTLTIPEGLTLIVRSGTTLTIQGTLDISGALTIDFGALTVSEGGALTIDAGGTLTNGYELDNMGTLTINANGTLTNQVFLDNEGTLTINANGTLTNRASLDNMGTLTINADGTLTNLGEIDDDVWPWWAELTNRGTLTIGTWGTDTDGGTLTNQGGLDNEGTLTIYAGGTFTNEGYFSFWQLNSNGISSTLTINAGGTLTNKYWLYNRGTLTINANGTLTNEGELENFGTLTIDADGTLTNEDRLDNYFTGTLTINAGGTLTNAFEGGGALLWNYGNLTINAGTLANEDQGTLSSVGTLTINADSTLTNEDQCDLENWGTLTIDADGTLTNQGMLTINADSTLTNEDQGDLENWGTLTIDADGTLTNEGELENFGTLTIDADGTLANEGELDNSGTLTINAGGTFTNEGILTNEGELNDARLSPPPPPMLSDGGDAR